jgi:hypothetical protein
VGIYLLLHQIGEATEWFGARAERVGLRDRISTFARRHRALSLALFMVVGALLGTGVWAWYVYRVADDSAPATALVVEYEPTVPITSVRPGQKIYLFQVRADGQTIVDLDGWRLRHQAG